jgi:hypothetical protein
MQPSADQPTDRRVTVVEAAAILGITPDAVRSRLRRGTLRKDEAPDGTVLVALSSDGRDGPDASAADRPTDQTTVAYIDGLKSKIEVLERELVDWKEEARRKDHLLAAALERIPAIEAPPDTPSSEPRGSPQTASEEPSGTQTPQEEERRSWWRRLFGG